LTLFIVNFESKLMRVEVDGTAEDSLNIENTAWSNTVVASGTAVGVVIYTGTETRSVMNCMTVCSMTRSKVKVTST